MRVICPPRPLCCHRLSRGLAVFDRSRCVEKGDWQECLDRPCVGHWECVYADGHGASRFGDRVLDVTNGDRHFDFWLDLPLGRKEDAQGNDVGHLGRHPDHFRRGHLRHHEISEMVTGNRASWAQSGGRTARSACFFIPPRINLFMYLSAYLLGGKENNGSYFF